MVSTSRWFLLKVHLNGPLTSARATVHLAGDDAVDGCVFCDHGQDSLAHITQCPKVIAAYEAICAMSLAPTLTDARPLLMLQTHVDGGVLASVIAFFAAVWYTRGVCHSRWRNPDLAN